MFQYFITNRWLFQGPIELNLPKLFFLSINTGLTSYFKTTLWGANDLILSFFSLMVLGALRCQFLWREIIFVNSSTLTCDACQWEDLGEHRGHGELAMANEEVVKVQKSSRNFEELLHYASNARIIVASTIFVCTYIPQFTAFCLQINMKLNKSFIILIYEYSGVHSIDFSKTRNGLQTQNVRMYSEYVLNAIYVKLSI